MARIFVVDRPNPEFDLFFDQVLAEPGSHSYAEGAPALTPLLRIIPKLIKTCAQRDPPQFGRLDRANQCEVIFLLDGERSRWFYRHIALPGFVGAAFTGGF